MQIELKQLGTNLTKLSLGNLDIFFSYETAVAYEDSQANLVASQNIWSSTTGKHLTQIGSDIADRIPNDRFTKELRRAIAKELKDID